MLEISGWFSGTCYMFAYVSCGVLIVQCDHISEMLAKLAMSKKVIV